MSGIIGIYCLDGRPVDRQDLQKMVDILAHRGPDGAAIWSDGSIGFGHRMLWTTPESLIEKLPLFRNDLIITADARIDNRDELQSVLDLPDRSIEKITDSEFILAAYEKWGEDCPKHLLGDFAFAIWDKRKQTLFCARDHMGVNPFYYHSSPKVFVFATEIKALLCLPGTHYQLNEIKIGDYLIANFEDTATTFYKEILRLPPAHSLVVSCRGSRIQSYWSLDPTRKLKLGSNADYAEAFRDIFTTAVHCRLRSAFPLGSRLSGGLDSSSVTCITRSLLDQQGKQPLLTFSTIYNTIASCDEQPFINEVLAQGNFQPHYLHGDQRSPLAEIDRILWHEDEPFFAPGLATTWGLSRVANQAGVRVLLDGHDGDGTVSHGFGYLHELARNGQWLKLATELKGLSKINNDPFSALLWSYVKPYAVLPLRRKARSLNLRRRFGQASGQQSEPNQPLSTQVPEWQMLLNPEFVQRIGLTDRYHACLKTQPDSARTERENHYRILTQGLQPFALEVLNKVAAAFSLEYRHPFWDKRLVEFCLSLPPEQKLHQGWSRIVLRRAMSDILPTKIQWRLSKTNFIEHLSCGLLAERQHLDELILQDSTQLAEYMNIFAVREIYNRFVSSEPQKDPHDVLSIWTAVTLAKWLTRIDCRSGMQPTSEETQLYLTS